MGYGLLNLGSLLLGLLAWILPVINIAKHGMAEHKSWAALSIASMSACAISLYLQILYGKHLVRIEDWSALMDTVGAVASAAVFLLTVTIILNAVTLAMYFNDSGK